MIQQLCAHAVLQARGGSASHLGRARRRLCSTAPSLLTVVILAACVAAEPIAETDQTGTPAELPRTRPERTGNAETSTHADVVWFLESLSAMRAAVSIGVLGTSTEGREIPYAIASRPLVASVEEARRLGRPIVYVQGNIHGGEVEGKEALQMLLRDLTSDPLPNALDSIVLIAVPIYNTDGNERFADQASNRGEQHGPGRVGERVNAQGLDLNRDYMKAVAPETSGSLMMFNRWDPDVFVDLHATNGSYHGYSLTYSPSLSPAAGSAGRLTRDELLPELRRRMRERYSLETFDYGNFSRTYGADVTPDTVREGWFTYDHRPRFGTNYYALRGRVSILSEAYSHEPFERRVASTYAFVREILSLAAERSESLLALRTTDPLTALEGRVPLRGELTRSPRMGEVIMELLETDADSMPAEPGVHPGIRRTGRFRTVSIPVHDHFDASLTRAAPAMYAMSAADSAAARLLEQHGIRVQRLTESATLPAEVFTIATVTRSSQPFQGYYEVRVEGQWHGEERTLPPGSILVPMDQPLAVLAMYLLEPESDDGLANWSSPADNAPSRRFLAAELREGGEYPVFRIRR